MQKGFGCTYGYRSQDNYQYKLFNFQSSMKTEFYADSWYQYPDLWEDEPVPVMTKPVVLTRYTYTGREYNREVDQYYYRARTYVSGLGRFTGKDPVGYPGYEYVKGNPVRYKDMSGKSIKDFASAVYSYVNRRIIHKIPNRVHNEKNESIEVVRGTYGLDDDCMGELTEKNYMVYGVFDIDFVKLNGTWYKLSGLFDYTITDNNISGGPSRKATQEELNNYINKVPPCEDK